MVAQIESLLVITSEDIRKPSFEDILTWIGIGAVSLCGGIGIGYLMKENELKRRPKL